MSHQGILTEFIVVSLLLCMSFVKCGVLQKKAPHYHQSLSSSLELPNIEVYEVKREGVESVKNEILVGKEDSALQMVNVSRNSELLFGELTRKESALLLHCHAQYSVQWIFRGDSDPEFNTNTTIRQDSTGRNVYSAYLFLGSRRNLNERDTGRYICTSVRNKRLNSYLYLYVTHAALFTNKGLETIYYSSKDDTIRIPCSLSEPRAIATLQKSQDGVLKCPINDSVRFDPKQGFILDTKRQQQPQGTYLCIADYNNTYQIIKYDVMKDESSPSEQTSDEFEESSTQRPHEYPPTPPSSQQSPPPPISDSPSASNNTCASKTCGKNAFCRINKKNGDALCRCNPGYIGNPYVECKHKSEFDITTASPPSPPHADSTTHHYPPPPSSTSNPDAGGSHEYACDSDEDCPNDRACIQNVCQDPCLVDPVCGPNTDCETSYHTPFCKCLSGYEGDPYSSQQGQQCEKSHCDPNPCGPNTVCKYVNGIISCSCKPGFATHNDGVCHPNLKNSPTKPTNLTQEVTVKPLSITENRTLTLPPGKECHYDTDCPDDKMCIQDKCEDPCVNACGSRATCHTRNHFPRCLCPEGTTGDPFYKCVPLFSGLIGIPTTTDLPPPLSTISDGEYDERGNCGGENYPCGPNTVCQASRNQFVCACPNNFVGDPYSVQGCVRKSGYLKCEQDSDCPNFLTCLRHQGCANPCHVKNVCPDGRSCVAYFHRPACLKTDNFLFQYPRDGLPLEKEELEFDTTDLLEIVEMPNGLNNSGCVIKESGKLISPCGKNSVCYDENSMTVNGLVGGAEGIYCGCMPDYVGDPYVACEPLQTCESTNNSACKDNEICLDGFCIVQITPTNSTKLATENITISGNPCSPSPCPNLEDMCMINRADFTAKCVSPSENIFASSQSHEPLEHLFRSDACQLSGACGDEYQNDGTEPEEIGSITTEISDSFTILPSTAATSMSYLQSAGLSSVEDIRNDNTSTKHLADILFNFSKETGPSLSHDEQAVVDA